MHVKISAVLLELFVVWWKCKCGRKVRKF